MQIADVGANGAPVDQQDYATVVNSRNAAVPSGFHPTDYVDTDEGYNPLNPVAGAEAPRAAPDRQARNRPGS